MGLGFFESLFDSPGSPDDDLHIGLPAFSPVLLQLE